MTYREALGHDPGYQALHDRITPALDERAGQNTQKVHLPPGSDGTALSSSAPRGADQTPSDQGALIFTCPNCALTFPEPFCDACGRRLIRT